MTRLRHHRSRGASTVFALALFLAGTNYCLVGGVASHFGARISCMAPAKAQPGSCHAAPGSSHCAQAGAPAGGGASHDGSAPARAATPPCCIALAPVVAASGVEIPANVLALALPVSPAADEPAPVLASWCGYRVTCDAGPPPLHSRAPLLPRAPPLA